MGKRLDELAKSLAGGKVSRRTALVRALGGAGAAAAATLLPGKAFADNNRLLVQCRQYCARLFPYHTTNACQQFQYDLCVSEAEMSQGPCYFMNGSPGFRMSSDNTGCPPGQVSCNGRCCQQDLCGEVFLSANGNNGFLLSGIYVTENINGNPCYNVNGTIVTDFWLNIYESPDYIASEICVSC